MNRNRNTSHIFFIIMFTFLICSISACSKDTAPQNTAAENQTPIDTDKEAVNDKENDSALEGAGEASENDDTAKESDEDTNPVNDAEEPDIDSPADTEETSADTAEENSQNEELPDVIWLGDSLTQGSLGDNNFNENNPQAPWRVLGEISGKKVSGMGLFGYKTHDIYWAYGEYGGIKNPDIIYVHWVGSNDFQASADSIEQVMEETDRFNKNTGITKYIVLGTPNRKDMDPNTHTMVNERLAEHYGERYLDVMPYVDFVPDGVHLTVDSYRKVAEAVYEKLKSLGYI